MASVQLDDILERIKKNGTFNKFDADVRHIRELIKDCPLFKNGDNVLLHVCRNNRLDDLQLILPYIRSPECIEFINYKNVKKDGVSVLFLCVDAQNPQLLKTILTLDGLDTGLTYKNNTILYYTLQLLLRHDTSELCDILIQSPRIDITRNQHHTPFLQDMIMVDAFSGSVSEHTKIKLIESVKNRDINYVLEVDNQGKTILHYSVTMNSIQLVTYLLDMVIILPAKEVQVDRFTVFEPEKRVHLDQIADSEGNLPFHIITSVPIYSLFIPVTPDINVMNHKGDTLLFSAIKEGYIGIIKALLQNQASYVKIQNKIGTLYHHIFAFSIDDFSFTRLNIPLLKANFGAFVNEQNEMGQTPFMMHKEYTNESIKQIRDCIRDGIVIDYSVCDTNGNNLIMFLVETYTLLKSLEDYIIFVVDNSPKDRDIILTWVNNDGNTVLMLLAHGIRLAFYHRVINFLYERTPDDYLKLETTSGKNTLLIKMFMSQGYKKENYTVMMSLFNKYVTFGKSLLNHQNKLGFTAFHFICRNYTNGIPFYETLRDLCFELYQAKLLDIDIKSNSGKRALELTSDNELKRLFGYSVYVGIDRIKLVDHLTTAPISVIKPIVSDSFTVISWNMYHGKCSNIREIKDILPYNDIIATQENHSSILPFDSITNGSQTEQVAMYSASAMSSTIKLSSEAKRTELGLESVPIRYAIMTSLKGITVGNIHMEGGRFTDLQFIKGDSTLQSYKLSLLEELTNQMPDILVGDFNSPYSEHTDIQRAFEHHQLDYFAKIAGDTLTVDQTERIYEWIRAPFRLLKEKGYTYASPRNQFEISNHLGKSIVDGIWYNAKKMECIDSYILPLPYNAVFCISDHNPVIASFKVKTEVYRDLPTTFTDNVSESVECHTVQNTIIPDIKARLDASPLVQAFHVTTEENALLIWNSGTLLCGRDGRFGPGIYCCPRPLDCIYKAAFRDGLRFIVLFEVELQMGHSLVSSESRSIDAREYDSVIYKRDTGLEYVVFRPHQVHIRKMYRMYLRNITELVKSYKQTRSDSFRAINNYVLGGWYFEPKPITRLHDLGPYHITSITNRMPHCPNEYKDGEFIGHVCTDGAISHNLLYSHSRVFESSKDITSFNGSRRTKRKWLRRTKRAKNSVKKTVASRGTKRSKKSVKKSVKRSRKR
jgi:ankyrin repeat protein